jgi:hypothetical protein
MENLKNSMEFSVVESLDIHKKEQNMFLSFMEGISRLFVNRISLLLPHILLHVLIYYSH